MSGAIKVGYAYLLNGDVIRDRLTEGVLTKTVQNHRCFMVVETTAGWRPIHDNHAIAAMAAVVTFAQPIPDRLLKATVEASEQAASELGLGSKAPIKALQIAVGSDGTLQTGSSAAVQGQTFDALFETPDGLPISTQVAEQLQVNQRAIIYRTWRYVSWKWQFDRISKLMARPLQTVKSAVAFGNIRLEYLDRFRFDGDVAAADTKQLLRIDCPLIAPHVFMARDLWHCHTGSFLTTIDHRKRLQQVMIDAIDEPYPPQEGVTPVRWINITTALEDRFTQQLTDDQEIDVDAVFQTLDTMHDSLKETLASIITEPTAKQIYLRNT
jgi:uncharacterized protein (TIGR04255 family)